MTLHGHEIPEEFVREVEAKVLRPHWDYSFAWMRQGFLTDGSDAKLRAISPALAADGMARFRLRLAILKSVMWRFRRAGKIEYLGRAQGWRVKRPCTTSAT